MAAGRLLKASSSRAVGPDGVPADLCQHLKAVHELHDPACFKSLPGVEEPRARIFIRGKPASRKLSVLRADLPVVPLRGVQQCDVTGRLIVHRRRPESLRDVHVVPVDDGRVPTRHVIMHLPSQGPAAMLRPFCYRARGHSPCCRPSATWASIRHRRILQGAHPASGSIAS